MPTYEYKCQSCPHRENLKTSIHENLKIPTCPKCKTEMVRSYSHTPVIFKGKGFYSTGD